MDIMQTKEERMSEYDGWVMKYIWEDHEGLCPSSFREKRSDVVKWWDGDMPYGSWMWKNWSRRKGNNHKIVKVKLMEMSD